MPDDFVLYLTRASHPQASVDACHVHRLRRESFCIGPMQRLHAMQDEPKRSILHSTRASHCSAKYSSVNPVFGRPGGVMELLLQLLSILLALLSLSVHGGFYGSPPARALFHSLDVQPSQETSGSVWSCGGAGGGEGGREGA